MSEKLRSFKPALLSALNRWANDFKVIGMSNSESPRWAQIMSQDGTVVLKSTQTPIWYEIPDERLHLLRKVQMLYSSEVWAEFREMRNEFLRINHPTIKL